MQRVRPGVPLSSAAGLAPAEETTFRVSEQVPPWLAWHLLIVRLVTDSPILISNALGVFFLLGDNYVSVGRHDQQLYTRTTLSTLHDFD